MAGAASNDSDLDVTDTFDPDRLPPGFYYMIRRSEIVVIAAVSLVFGFAAGNLVRFSGLVLPCDTPPTFMINDQHARPQAVSRTGRGPQANIEAERQEFGGIAVNQDRIIDDRRVKPNAPLPEFGAVFCEVLAPSALDAHARYQPLRPWIQLEIDHVRGARKGRHLRHCHCWKVVWLRSSVKQPRGHGSYQASDNGAERKNGDQRQIRFDDAPELAQLDFLLWAGRVQGDRGASVAGGRPANHKATT